MVDERRVRILKNGQIGEGPIVYVMGRDFRVDDNWALLAAQEIALERKVPFGVVVHIGKNFIKGTVRQHTFLIESLKETSCELEKLNIPFFVTFGRWQTELTKFIRVHSVAALVTDFSPIKESRAWWSDVIKKVTIPVYEVDAHNIVPSWLVSDSEETSARTFRSKYNKVYEEFLTDFPPVKKHQYIWNLDDKHCWPRGVDENGFPEIDWDGVTQFRAPDKHVDRVYWCAPGEKAALTALKIFVKDRLKFYDAKRNNPNEKACSDLSPYIRYGLISAQRVALTVKKSRCKPESKKTFLEELIIRRELAENYCLYQKNYTKFIGLKPWAQETLKKHAKDKRTYTYSLKQFEHADTHDELWNAAQTEMVKRGKMHGYMRMYWAKKILEWSKSPEDAIRIAIVLNDRYSLDGRDSSGYVGILWAIGGVHDRAWAERPIYGKIRYMNKNGCKRKFDIEAYIAYSKTL